MVLGRSESTKVKYKIVKFDNIHGYKVYYITCMPDFHSTDFTSYLVLPSTTVDAQLPTSFPHFLCRKIFFLENCSILIR